MRRCSRSVAHSTSEDVRIVMSGHETRHQRLFFIFIGMEDLWPADNGNGDALRRPRYQRFVFLYFFVVEDSA